MIPLKVVFDNTIFMLQKQGGISRYFLEITRRLNKFEGVQADILKLMGGKFSRLNGLLMSYYSKIKKFDIYHPTYYSRLVRERKSTKIVLTVYDMIHELYLSGLNNFKDDIRVKERSIRNADHIICISDNTRKDLERIYKIDSSRISVIYLGSPEVSLERRAAPCPLPARPYVLYVGKRGGYKNFSLILEAFKNLGLSRSLDIICFGAGEFNKQERQQFRKYRIESIRQVEGADEKLRFYYENAAMLVYPSLYEGFGLPIIEAMAYSCPVIASNSSSVAEVASDAALLFDPKNVEELGEYIKRVFNDRDLRQDLVKKGLKRSSEFSWEKTARETFNVYKSLLN